MNIIQRRLFKYLLSCGLIMGLAAPVFSQEDNSGKGIETLELEEMTVTAEKREENIQEVPMSVSAYSEISLEDAGVDDVRDVAVMVPNFHLGNYSGWGYRANFRGMNYSDFTNKLPLVMYVDNVPYDEGNTFVGDFNNIERIEVLRGANGTLYGQNALAGVINIISKTPGNEPEGKATVKIGQHETFGANAYYNGPITEDKLFFGFSGSYDQTAGFQENDYPGEDTYGGGKTSRAKGRLRWEASERLTADMTLSVYQYQSEGGIGNTVSGTDWSDHEYRDPDDVNDMDSNQVSLELTYEADAFDLKSITTRRVTDKDWIMHAGYTNPIVGRITNSTETQSTTQEIRLQSKESNSGTKWLAGLFFMNEKKKQKELGLEYYYNMYAAYGGSASYTYLNWPAEHEAKSQSIFGQLTFPLIDKMELTTGARYETIEKKMDYTFEVVDTYGSSGNSLNGTNIVPRSTYSISSDWTAFLPRAVLSYKINPEDMMFISYSRGYLPGGFNATEAVKDNAEFDAQYSTNVEMGAKTGWLSGRLMLNASIFHTDITDMHVYDMPSPGTYVTSNAGEARSQGAEIEIAVTPISGLEFSAALGVLDCEFTDYEGKDNNEPADTPDFTAYLSAKYRPGSGFYIGGSVQGRGDAYADDDNTVEKEGYWIANARVGYERKSWDIYLNVENLTDTEYLENITVGEGMLYSTVGKPRTVSLIASKRF